MIFNRDAPERPVDFEGRFPIFRHALCLYPYRKELRRGRYYPPLGLEMIAGALAPHCEKLDVVDLRQEAGRAVDFVLPETDLICLSVNWDRDTEFVREELQSLPAGPLVVVGGRHATEAPGEWLKGCPRIDILVRGDGESAIVEIARRLPREEIAGLSFRRDGKVVHNPNRHVEPIRDDLFADRSRRRSRYAVDFEGADTGITFDSLSGSRGCPFNCRFCSFSLNPLGEKRAYSARSPESVVEELAGMSADVVGFTDDVFTHDMDRVAAICDLIVKRDIRKRYVVNSRIEISRRMDVVRKMERAGFAALLLGVESAQDRTLTAMNKGFNRARIEEHFRVLRHTSMILHGYFILGCIGESEAEMLEIAPFARSLGLDTVGLSPLRTVPYDGLRDLVAANPGYHVSGRGFVYSDAISREDLRRIRRQIWRRFYTPAHAMGLGWKLLRGGMIPWTRLPRLLFAGARGTWSKYGPRRRRKRPAP